MTHGKKIESLQKKVISARGASDYLFGGHEHGQMQLTMRLLKKEGWSISTDEWGIAYCHPPKEEEPELRYADQHGCAMHSLGYHDAHCTCRYIYTSDPHPTLVRVRDIKEYENR